MGYLLLLLLGFTNGARTLTPIAVLCWFSYTGLLHFAGWRTFTASIIAAILFSLMALGEYIGDKLPKTPSRTSAIGLSGRLLFGAGIGVLLAPILHANPAITGIVGALGALIGTFATFHLRKIFAERAGKDWPIANLEDWIAITASILLLNAIIHLTVIL